MAKKSPLALKGPIETVLIVRRGWPPKAARSDRTMSIKAPWDEA
jgi:hypothetical protein